MIDPQPNNALFRIDSVGLNCKFDTNLIISATEGSTHTADFSPSESYQTNIIVITDCDPAGYLKNLLLH